MNPHDSASNPLSPAAGVTVERRALLWLPFAAAGASPLLGAPFRAEQDPMEEARDTGALTPLSWRECAQRWRTLARELELLPSTADESYAGALAALIARVPPAELPRLNGGNQRAGMRAGPSWFLTPVVTIEFALEEGAELRPHNHPPQVVLTLCADGELRYRHFEVEGPAPACDSGSKQSFTVRETRVGILGPGRSTTLTRERDGIHGFQAHGGAARLIDFTLSLSEDEAFSYVELGEARDPERRLFEAHWLGKS
jgi:hypothetical protein